MPWVFTASREATPCPGNGSCIRQEARLELSGNDPRSSLAVADKSQRPSENDPVRVQLSPKESPEDRRVTAMFRNLFGQADRKLTRKLLKQGRKDQAAKVLQRAQARTPAE